MGEKWLSLGSVWWHPWRGAREAVREQGMPFWGVLLVIGLEIAAMSMASLLSFGVQFSSVFSVVFLLGFFSVGTLVFWGVIVSVMMFFLVVVFRRVIVPERLLFLVAVSHLPWLALFPAFLLSLGFPGMGRVISLGAIGLSFCWLWEMLHLEYALSRKKAFFVMVVPFGVLVLQAMVWIGQLLVMIGLQGVA
ncbi:MAG: hypothetical protein N2314_06325 [Brevinematales bacterium]|nr:hypothetical protein [Brevinematales bacterium]